MSYIALGQGTEEKIGLPFMHIINLGTYSYSLIVRNTPFFWEDDLHLIQDLKDCN
jgi:hypothetical protein